MFVQPSFSSKSLHNLKSTSSLHHQLLSPITVSRSGGILWVTSWLWLPEEKGSWSPSSFPSTHYREISAPMGGSPWQQWTNINFFEKVRNLAFWLRSIHTWLAWLHHMQYMFLFCLHNVHVIIICYDLTFWLSSQFLLILAWKLQKFFEIILTPLCHCEQ